MSLNLFRRNKQQTGSSSSSSPRRNKRFGASGRRSRFTQLAMEQLEPRMLLAVNILNGSGSGFAGNGGGGPPDETGAAGPNSYMEATNSTVTIFNKETGGIVNQANIFNFFYTVGGLTQIDAGSCGVCDSTLVFDNLMGADGRFIVGDIDINQTTNVSQYIFAVSTTSSPATLTAADWNFYQITTTTGPAGNTEWTDYPGNPGFNKDAFVETFNKAQGGFLTGNSLILSINSNDLAAGVPQASLRFNLNTINGSTSFRPTTMHDSVTGDPMWLVRNPNNGTNINVTRMDSVLSNAAVFTTTSLALPAGSTFATGNINPLNPSGTAMNDIDTRILKAGENNQVIAATHKIRISATEADVQWYAIDVSGPAPVFQTVAGDPNVGRIGFGANTYTYEPAIDINPAGQIGLAFMQSDTVGGAANVLTGGSPSMFVTARTPGDAAGTMQTPVLVPAGTGTGNIGTGSTRIGDFSGMNVDPVNGTFWAVNQFASGGGGPTAIANFAPLPPGISFQNNKLLIFGDQLYPDQDDTVRLVRDPADNTQLDVFVNNTTALPNFQIPIVLVNKIDVFGLGGNDTLIVDSTNGLINVPLGIDYNGGNGFDRLDLRQTGGSQTSERINIGANPGDGQDIVVGAGGTQTVNFSDLEPVTTNIVAATFSITSVPGIASLLQDDNQINYQTSGLFGPTWGRVTVDNFEPIEFINKTNLIIDAGAGSDEINLNNPNTPTALAGITVNGDDPTASDTVIVNGTAGADNVTIDQMTFDGARVTGAGPVQITVATAEHLLYSGQSGSDNLTVTMPNNADIDYIPGAVADAGSILGRLGPNLLPVAFQTLGSAVRQYRHAGQ